MKKIFILIAENGRCHEMAVNFAEELPLKHDIVTGYAHTMSKNLKYLHTWAETNLDGKNPIVIDYTMNAVINKKGYYLLKHIKPLCRISNKVLQKDLDILENEPYYYNLEAKEYLVFRDRIMNNLKNKKDFYDRGL